nr:MAG TPA: Terminase small subunit [Caudoviricetes sp.]
MSKLTIKQENFCNYYIESGNASEAYRRAFSCGKMKAESVNRKAVELLNNGKITARVEQLQSDLKSRSDITKEEAVKELANIVRVNPLDYIEISPDEQIEVKENGDIISSNKQTVLVKDLSELTIEQQRCIKSISPVRGGIKIEFESKISAIDRLSKMLGWDEAIKTDVNLTSKPLTKEQAKAIIDELGE